MDTIKKLVGYRAADLVEDGMIVGIGTGSTAFYFIEKLIEKAREGLSVTFIASSSASRKQALEGGLVEVDLKTITQIDLTVDGADEIDAHLNMIKGGGGALLREKILAHFSQTMVVIADETKFSQTLGKVKLPLEILPFASSMIIEEIKSKIGDGQIRTKADKTPFITDNGNLIFDLASLGTISSARKLHEKIIEIPGVLETGLFFNVAKLALIGYQDKNIQIIQARL